MQDFDLYIVTSFGSRIFGGSDIWVNNYFKEVIPKKGRNYKILVDNSPKDEIIYWDDSIEFCYSGDPQSIEMLENCSNIFLLHIGYIPKSYQDEYSYLDKYVDKIQAYYMHVYPKFAKETWKKYKNTESPFDLDWFEYLINKSKRNIWIGIDLLPDTEQIPKMKWIPNYYEYKWNKKFKPVTSSTIGYAARLEPRKNFHYLKGHKFISFTNNKSLKILYPELSRDNFNIEYNYKFLENFYTMDKWQIFHACYDREPFGYSIFNALDAGKLPILHKKWGINLKYKYTASNKEEFDQTVSAILNDSPEEQEAEFNNLKKQLFFYNSKDRWINDILTVEQE